MFRNKKGIRKSDEKKSGMQDFREKGAKMQDQGPPPPYPISRPWKHPINLS